MDFDQATDECLAGRLVRRRSWEHPDRAMRVQWGQVPGYYHLVLTVPPTQLEPADMQAEDWVSLGALQ